MNKHIISAIFFISCFLTLSTRQVSAEVVPSYVEFDIKVNWIYIEPNKDTNGILYSMVAKGINQVDNQSIYFGFKITTVQLAFAANSSAAVFGRDDATG